MICLSLFLSRNCVIFIQKSEKMRILTPEIRVIEQQYDNASKTESVLIECVHTACTEILDSKISFYLHR